MFGIREHKNLIRLFAILVFSSALFILVLVRQNYKPTQDNLEQTPVVKTEETTQGEEDISHFFEQGSAKTEEKVSAPKSSISKDKKPTCVLENQTVQEGTVASDTVCINQSQK